METSPGRALFISMISNHNNNIVPLKEKSFLLLEELMIHVLNSCLKLEETDQLIEEIVLIILDSRFYEATIEITKVKKKKKIKEKIKENKTMFNHMEKFLQGYYKIRLMNFWKKWYDLELNRRQGEDIDENIKKKEIILDMCKKMIFLKIAKSTIKNIIDNINKNIFKKGTEIYKQIKKQYDDLIEKANIK